MDLQVQLASPAPAQAAPLRRMRAPVGLPDGLQIRREEPMPIPGGTQRGAIVIRRSWLRGKHYLLFAVFAALSAGLVLAFQEHGLVFWTGFAAFILVNWNYQLLAMFLNQTTIEVREGKLTIRHGPIPTLTARNVAYERQALKQLYAAKHGFAYAVRAQLTDGGSVMLVSTLITAEQALFVEQQLEDALGIVDFEVPEELSHDMPALVGAASGKKKSNAPAGFVALAPILIGASAFILFYLVAKTEVSGSFHVDDGAFAFAPTDCRSGHAYGFFGVDVVDDAGNVVRVLQDPVKGAAVVVQRSGAGPAALDLAQCATVSVQVRRTNTTINDVHVLEGEAHVSCDGARGDLTFAGCH